MKHKLSKLLIYIGVPVVIVLIAFFVKKAVDSGASIPREARDNKTNATVEPVAEPVTETEEPEVSLLETLGVEIPGKDLDWDELQKTNKDIYAWIVVPGTDVDYPVLQRPDSDDYYLDHNLDGSEGKPGCIYTQTYNEKDFSDPMTVLYGHNMKDGSMFAGLHAFGDAAFFEDNRYFFIYTPEETFVYEIFGAYEGGDEHLLLTVDTKTYESFTYYLQQILSGDRSMSDHLRSERELGTELSGNSKIVTLSTCITGRKEKRWLVQGVLIGQRP